ncbi:hypothetical protein C4566_01270 [Candidatus Parcubacteria bacterium]|nr:MAG: hypothetical protein C4566_01270 [Candidatus Parcubacteria bacterium]
MLDNYNSPLNLRLIKKCPVCNTDYQQSMIQVLDESEFGVLTYATCDRCGANLLAKFASMPQGVIGNAILTDLKPQEVMDFATNESISDDDVLDMQYMIGKKELINSLKKLI